MTIGAVSCSVVNSSTDMHDLLPSRAGSVVLRLLTMFPVGFCRLLLLSRVSQRKLNCGLDKIGYWRTWHGSPAWIRTTIHGSKGRCPTIRRPGNKRQAVTKSV
jgi:hypothetical protein